MEIKRLLESGYIIIPDTNVLLNLYRYSPEFSEFGVQCLQEVKYSLQGTTQGRYLTGGVPPVRFSM